MTLDEDVAVVAGAGAGLTALELQAALRTMASNVCKGAGVARDVVAWRIFNTGRLALLCTIIVWTVDVLD